jgi:hypothetical protein
MNPDFTSMVNDFGRPVVSLFLFIFMILGWIVAYQLMKEVTELKIKLGREAHQEELKDWFIRKSAHLILPIYSLKNRIAAIEFQAMLYKLLRKKKRIWKFIFQLD